MNAKDIDLEWALKFTEVKLAEGFKSDGCTFFPELGIKRFCQMHDALWRFNPFGITKLRSDILFVKGICTKGPRYYPVAAIAFIGVRIGALFRYGWR